jgi:WD40 repeat protein
VKTPFGFSQTSLSALLAILLALAIHRTSFGGDAVITPNPDDLIAHYPGSLFVCDQSEDRSRLLAIDHARWLLLHADSLKPVAGSSILFPGKQICAASFSPDGRHICARSSDGSAIAWDLSTGRQEYVIRDPSDHFILSAMYSRDGRTLLTRAFKSICFWDAKDGKSLLPAIVPLGVGGAFIDVQWSSTSRRIFTREDSHPSALWDTNTGKLVQGFSASGKGSENFTCATFSPDGAELAVGCDEGANGAVLIFNSASGKLLRRIAGTIRNLPWRLAYSPDGKKIVCEEHNLHLFDATSGKELAHFPANPDPILKFSPHGSEVVEAGSSGRLYDLTLRHVHLDFATGSNVASVFFTKDSNGLIVSYEDGTTYVWKIER